MTALRTFTVAIGLAVLVQASSFAEEKQDQSAEAQQAKPQAKCLEAVVNPVAGFAFCVNPRGAPVDPPARTSLNRPCKPKPHDADPFTVYEHWSGCDE